MGSKDKLFGFLLTLGLAACGTESEPGAPDVGSSADSILIGAVYNTSGYQAVVDDPSLKGAKLAAAQINDAGGVLDRRLDLITITGDSDAQTLADKTGQAIVDHPAMAALMGLSDTDMALAVAPVAVERDKVFVTSGATSPQLPGQVSGGLFLACFGDNVQAAAAAEWSYNSLGARTALVLFDPSESYTRLLQGYFVERFGELGGTISDTISLDPGGEVPAPGEVDMVFLSVETAEDAAPLAAKLRAGGYTGPIVGGDGYDAASIWAGQPDITNVYFTTHAYMGADNPNPEVGAFVKAYQAANDGEEPSSFAALGYDTIGLLAAAIEKQGNAESATLGDALMAVNDYPGITGTISFAGGSHIPTKGVSILKVEGGKQLFVSEVVPASVPAP